MVALSRSTGISGLLILAVCASPRLISAQQKTPRPREVPAAPNDPIDQSHWRVRSVVRVDESFDNNPFLLSDTRKAALTSLATPSLPGGRYAGMLEGTDWITAVRGAVAAEGAGLFGRRTSFGLDAEYQYYHRNTKRRNVDFRLSAMQSLGHGAQLGVRADLQPRFYFRNYMSDAVDANADGRIQSSERTYAAGTYANNDVAVEYRQRLVRSAPDHPFGAKVVLLGGQESRRYEAPFATRTYRGPFGSAMVDLDLMSGLSMDLGYRRASLASTPGMSVLVVNEPDFNHDFNGNGTITDLAVRSVQMVDFSRVEQSLSSHVRAELSDNVDTELSFVRRNRSFGSKEPYDVYNNTRRDHRERMGVSVSFRVIPQTRLKVGVLSESQKYSNTLRVNPLDDVTAYTRKTFILSLAYHL
jgi:hypothetical protein